MSLNSQQVRPADRISLENETLTQLSQSVERVCEKLDAWRMNNRDPANSFAISSIVHSCRATVQQCLQYSANQTLLAWGLAVESCADSHLPVPSEHGPSLQRLFDECKRRIIEASQLLDEHIHQPIPSFSDQSVAGVNEWSINTSPPLPTHSEHIFKILKEMMSPTCGAKFASITRSSSPILRARVDRLRAEAEERLLPELTFLMGDLIGEAAQKSESKISINWSSTRPFFPSADPSWNDVDNRFLQCLDVLSSLAPTFNSINDLGYIHTYPTKSDVPYSIVPGILPGSGSFGEVYKVVHRRTEGFYALKQVKKLYSTKKRKAVLQELGMLEKCDHTNVITILDAYQVDDDPTTICLVTHPWAPYTLESFLHDRDSDREVACPWFSDASLAAERMVYKMLKGLADGLEYLHMISIKHKDIKPGNILLYNADSESLQPIIADLGISKIFKEGGSTNYVESTPAFLAPEQISYKGSSLKSDVWQLGCCFALILAVLRGRSAGCRSLWSSFENSDGNCSSNIAQKSHHFMAAFKSLCGRGTPSQRSAYQLVKSMLEIEPSARPDITEIRKRLEKLL